ncbi:filamentous hemagglutinin, partial [Comamonas sp. BIGb0124]|uniref:two-partner secretion domain-containing protein n=1 Tax=Comamonas sp. BIGb0124 TaxID=2485130 RepID=UPI000F4A4E22
MNSNLYKLVFSTRVGTWVAVSPVTRARGKGSRSGPGSQALAVVMATLGLLPAMAQAGLEVDGNASAGQRAGISQAANGVPVVNIVAPGSQGISHNKFTQFDVDARGLILNNSQTDGISQIGGFVVKNGNLGNGPAARGALLEVNGGAPSQLRGALEGFGNQKMDVFIANESGIVGNGVSSVNLNSLTLTTGRPQLNADGTVRFDVRGGQITVEGSGINTSGLSYFDLVARAIRLNALVASHGSTAEIQVVAGLNSYNPASRSFYKLADGGEGAPVWAIDGSTLGAMYGRMIRFVSTESGLGVRHQGVVASTGDVRITAAGDLSVADVYAKVGLRLEGEGIAVAAGKRLDADTVSVLARGELAVDGSLTGERIGLEAQALNNRGKIVAERVLAVQAGRVDNSGALQAGESMSIDATGRLDNRKGGTIRAGDDLLLKVGALGNEGGGVLAAIGGKVSAVVAGDVNNAGT